MAAESADVGPSLGKRLTEARARAFVGRAEDLARSTAALAGGGDAPPVFYVHGPGGIGKSSLLRQSQACRCAPLWTGLDSSEQCAGWRVDGSMPLTPVNQSEVKAEMETTVKFLFENESFSFEALRTAGYACYGGADLGEVLVTACGIPEGDEALWHDRWKALADRLRAVGMAALQAGHRVSARDTLLRASGYYRAADFYLRDDPVGDPEVALLSQRVQETFATAAALLDHPAEPVAIRFGPTVLPGYLFRPDDSGAPRPTLIYHGGYDSVLEEAYFAAAAGAVRRGYNCLAFDGPGQGGVLRDQRLTFRPDWETVVSAAVDFAIKRPEVDSERLALMGTSFGGFLAARAAAFEHRLAAVIVHDAIFDASSSGWRILPPGVRDAALEGRDDDVARALAGPMAESTGLRWFIRNGMWAFGADSPAALFRRTSYTLDGAAGQIACPTLLLEAENDATFRGEAQRIAQALNCPYEHIVLTDAEGAGEHCHEGAMLAFHQRAFDWLDTVLAR